MVIVCRIVVMSLARVAAKRLLSVYRLQRTLVTCPGITTLSFRQPHCLRFCSSEATTAVNKETGKGPQLEKNFQADTKKLLDIVAKSLYSDKEVCSLLV